MTPRDRTGQARSRRGHREDGIALIVVALILVLAAATALAGIDFSSQEWQAGGRARATSRVLYAADAGVQLSLRRIQPPRDLTPFDFDLPNGTNVQSRTRDDAAPQPIDEAGIGKPPDGMSINIGSGFVNEVFQVNVSATAANRSTSELEARLGALTANSGGM